MDLILRDYQEDLLKRARNKLTKIRSLLIQLCTGGGKTAIAAKIMQNSTAKGLTVFFVCHRKELIEQTSKTLKKFGIEHGVIASGVAPNFFKSVQVCSIDTIKNRLEKIPLAPNIIIWDECHHIKANGWMTVKNHYSKSYHIGLSATPKRLDGKPLDAFEDIICGPPMRWLIDNGYLADYKLFSIPTADFSELKTVAGDYNKGQVADIMSDAHVIGCVFNHWKKYASDRLTIGFAANVAMAEKYAADFRARGINSVALDGGTDKAYRKKALIDLARGEVRVVWNCQLFGEGYDIAANTGLDVTIGAVIDAAKTKSLVNWMQRGGRALRPQDSKAVILDHGGNFFEHGAFCQHRKWSLDGVEGDKKESGEASQAVKQCEYCHNVDLGRPKICSNCGSEYPILEREIKHADGELIEVSIDRDQQRIEQAKAKTADDLKNIEKNRGYKKGWNNHVQKARDEKERLRRELFNLCVACETLKKPLQFKKSDIKTFKPKRLIAEIEALNNMLGMGAINA